MLTNPLMDKLSQSQTVLLAGAGGGFDVFSALPLYFALENAGKRVHLANLSFSNLHPNAGRRLCGEVVEITRDSSGSTSYFPERHLAQWLADLGKTAPVWAIERRGPAAVSRAYRALADELKPDTIILVDGGTDSLMRGDESGLGTPVEDVGSIAAVAVLADVPGKYLVCLGFGIDSFHGVSHMDVLEAIAELTKSGGYLGAFSLTPDMTEVQRFLDATRYVMEQTTSRPSIVCSSIISAIAGYFGDVHSTERTAGSELFINPLMALYWAFRLDHVVRRNLYIDHVRLLEGFIETEMAIEHFRDSLSAKKPVRGIPL